MDEFSPEDNQYDILEAEGEISEEARSKLEEYLGLGPDRSVDGETFALFREKSRFSIGTPVPLPLKEYLSLSGRVPFPELQAQMKDYEFCPVQLACSFLPASGCRFHDARFDIALQALPTSARASDLKVPLEAMAYDFFPASAEDKVEVTRQQGGGLVAVFPGGTSISVPLPQTGEKGISHQVYVEASGLQNNRVTWTFTRTGYREISGSHPLLLLVRKPKGTSVQAMFNLAVHVEVLIGRRALDMLLPLVILFRRSGSSAIITEPAVSLC